MRGIPALIATALFLLAPTSLLQAADAQVNDGYLSGTVCTAEGLVQYDNVSADQPICVGFPLPDAQVRVTKAGVVAGVGAVERTVTTDAKGGFEFPDLPAGTYAIAVSRAGFADATGEATVQADVAARADIGMAGEKVTGKGQVTNQDGAALGDVFVAVEGTDGETRSDADGMFQFTVQAGYRHVKAFLAGHQDFHSEFLVDGEAPLKVVLRSLDAQPDQDAAIAGVVRDQHGKPVPGITIHVYSSGGGCGPDYCYDYACPAYESDPAGTEPAPIMPCRMPYYGGENTTTTGKDGSYRINVVGDAYHSLSIYQEGYGNWYHGTSVKPGQTLQLDIELMKFPEKTAQLVGKVTDLKTGKGLQLVSLSLNWPQYGVYECSDNGVGYPYPEPMPAQETDPDHETNTVSGRPENGGTASDGTATAQGSAAPSDAKIAVMPYPGGSPGCRIKINEDGTFSAMVTPGYATYSAYYEVYKDCAYDSSGQQSKCGPDYFGWTGVLVLAESGQTRLDIALPPKPAPDATLAGYVVDGATKKAIPNAWVSMWNLDNTGGGSAQTDGDGSFKVALRNGYHNVNVYVDGFLPWQATIFVKPGDNQFDVVLTAGKATYGGCYYCVMDGTMVKSAGAEDSSAGPTPSAMPPGTTTATPSTGPGAQTGGKDQAFADLGGGLGPYDAEKRAQAAQAGDAKASPSVELVALVGLLAGLAVALRRRA